MPNLATKKAINVRIITISNTASITATMATTNPTALANANTMSD